MPEVAVAPRSSETGALQELLGRAAAKDRTHIQRHLATADAENDPAHAALWRRLASTIGALAPLPIQTSGHTAVLFFVPDGKYRMQLFALEDQSDGRIAVYLPDMLAQAIQKKIVKKTAVPGEFAIVGSMRNTLRLDSLDSQNSPEPPAHVKNMLGWNRKALRITLPALTAEGPRVDATEAMCNLAIKLRAAGQEKPTATVVKPAAAPHPAPRTANRKKRTA